MIGQCGVNFDPLERIGVGEKFEEQLGQGRGPEVMNGAASRCTGTGAEGKGRIWDLHFLR